MVFEVKGAFGAGFEISYNLSEGKGEINFLPAALGVEMSANLQPRAAIAIPLAETPTSGKMAIAWSGGVDFALGAKIGLDTKLDPGGKIELTPKAGFGVGEFQQVAPSVTLYDWQNFGSDSKVPNQ